jgi:hypothetical protein
VHVTANVDHRIDNSNIGEEANHPLKGRLPTINLDRLRLERGVGDTPSLPGPHVQLVVPSFERGNLNGELLGII